MDGDREELRNIRNELSALKTSALQNNSEAARQSHQPAANAVDPKSHHSPYIPRPYEPREYRPASRQHLMQQRNDETLTAASNQQEASDESKTVTPTKCAAPVQTTPQSEHVRYLSEQLQRLFDTGLYSDQDAAVLQIRAKIAEASAQAPLDV